MKVRFTFFLCAIFLGLCSIVPSQEVIIQPSVEAGGKFQIGEGAIPHTVPPGQPPPGKDGKPPPTGGPKKEGEKPADGKGKPGEAKPDEGAIKPVKRSAEPSKDYDPKAFDARPGENKKVRLNVQGAPWVEVIEWLGEISQMSVDWQELPGDFLNFRMHREYTVEEMRNLINRHLLTRGYTMLINGEMLSVEKTDAINRSLVPRIQPSELENHLPFEFARASFPLKSLIASEIAKELEPMVSKNGKMNALQSTNRIEMMDTIGNLQQVHRLLTEEQSDVSSLSVREFVFKNIAADVAVMKLKELLNVNSSAMPMTPQMLAMQQQQQQQRNRGQPNQGKKQPPQMAAPKKKTSFVVNERRNSAIVQATPDQMAVIEQSIRLLDVSAHEDSSLDRYLSRLQTYRLTTLDPKEVVEILRETGVMDPTTMLKVDEGSKSIIANAPPWDHMTIDKMIKKLDGKSRSFRVVRLRRRRADQVATTIETLMVGPKEDENQRNRYRFYGYGGSEKKDNESFRVGADIEHNWLLLWCNDIEYEKVEALLGELGELTSRNRSANQIRILENVSSDVDVETLEKLRRAFERFAPNQIEWEIELEKKPEPKKEESPEDDEKKEMPIENEVATSLGTSSRDMFVALLSDVELDARGANAGASTEEKQQQKLPPIRVFKDSRGRLSIQSTDVNALDIFEELTTQIIRKKRDYKVFQLEHASPLFVALTLEEFFEEETSDDGNDDFPYYFFGFDRDNEEKKPSGLGDRQKITFVSDSDSKTIVVRNATASQLVTVQELIDLYDIPEPITTEQTRYTKLIVLKHAKAQTLADTIKGAFADLLSKNDAALQQQRQQQGNNNRRNNNRGRRDEQEQPSPIATSSLQGKLAIGIDETSNVIVISTKGEKLMMVVLKMVDELDQQAQQNESVQVVQLKSSKPESIHQTVTALLGMKKGQNNNQKPGEKPENGEQPNQNQDGNKGRNQNRSNGTVDVPLK